jgi:hypothetical protein
MNADLTSDDEFHSAQSSINENLDRSSVFGDKFHGFDDEFHGFEDEPNLNEELDNTPLKPPPLKSFLDLVDALSFLVN